MEYYYRTTFNDMGKFEPLDQTSPPMEKQIGKHDVFDHFSKDITNKFNEGHVVLFVTFTLHKTIKYNNRLLWDSRPEKQAEALRAKINSAMTYYEKKYRTGSMSYWFFESTQTGKIHAHGIFAQCNDEQYYPIHIARLMPCFLKQGFKSAGTKIEYPKILKNVMTYISKDYGKHNITPLYVLR